jgi:tripartite-type tricarboxylate transporter receptor subunit TctC
MRVIIRINYLWHFFWILAIFSHSNFTYAAYPDRPVKIVVGYPAGGGGDIIARVIAQRLSALLNGNFIVDNKPGAGAMLAAGLVAKSPADGYTLLLGSSAEMTISPLLYSRIAYNPESDLLPITLLGISPVILVANPHFSGENILDVITEAKKDPGKLVIGSGGAGTPPQMAAEELKIVGNINFTIAPYKGGAPAQTDAIAGHIPLVFTTIATALPAIKAKQLKPLTVLAPKRSTLLPEVASSAELGLKNYQVGTWFGLFAPINTPSNIIDLLRNSVSQSMQNIDVRNQFEMLGLEPATGPESTGKALQIRISEELIHWKEIIKKAGINKE